MALPDLFPQLLWMAGINIRLLYTGADLGGGALAAVAPLS